MSGNKNNTDEDASAHKVTEEQHIAESFADGGDKSDSHPNDVLEYVHCQISAVFTKD